jgi:hypothetical protein
MAEVIFMSANNERPEASRPFIVTARSLPSAIYIRPWAVDDSSPCGETSCRRDIHPRKNKTMGDRSPKSNQKMSNQKQSKATVLAQNKKQAVTDKQAAGKKK